MFALCFTITCNAQLSKADFEATFTRFPFENMTALYIKNVRTYYTDESNKLMQDEYDLSVFTYELTETALHLFYHTDANKTTVKGVMIYPYNKIITMAASAKGLTLELVY